MNETKTSTLDMLLMFTAVPIIIVFITAKTYYKELLGALITFTILYKCW